MAAPFKRVLVLDFETMWDSKEYTLSKMTTEEYIRDPRFNAWGCCFKWLGDPGKARWVSYKHLPEYLARIDWSTTAILAQNTMFDGAILHWRYGVRPCFYFDTLSMGRAVRGVERGNSLAKMAEDYGLPAKGRAVHSTDGMLSYEVMPRNVEEELAEYCKHDVYLCEEIFKRLVMLERDTQCLKYPLADMKDWKYPIKELRLIDMTLRMFVEPKIELDADMLTDALHEEKETREALLNRLNITDGILASTQQFAELLRSIGVEPPTKKSPTTKLPIPALAKNDALFQAMLNGEDENLALLCEARLKVKSTTERTRAQRFLDISQRGPLPVPLSYYGALSGRWTATRGSAINMQNLKRGSFLRKALIAPWGYEFGVVDLSQIEPRTLAWTADYEDLMDVFRAGDDPYAVFGRTMFNMPELTKVSSPVHRQAAKSAMLGCFGPDTLVLTARGWTPIVSVQATDTVWDGEEWVQHGGVLAQGEKEVLTALGVSATSDHEILTERGWAAWSAVLQDRSLLQSALSLANSHVSPGSAQSTYVAIGCTTLECAAVAGGKGSSTEATSSKDARPAATAAQKRKLLKRAGRILATTRSVPTEHTASDCLQESAQSSRAAQTQRAASTLTTAGVALASISRGLRTASSFCATLLASMGGIVRSFSLIERTTAVATSPAIFASSLAVSTCPTSAGSQHESSKRSNSALPFSKQRMQTYDVSFAGPRSRFTIWSAEGPLIVHNCGYQLGWASFAAQLLVGFLGAPPVRYGKEFAKQLGIDRSYIERFLDYTPNVIAMGEIPHSCTGQELLVHCVVAHKIIQLYRAAAYPVVGLWKRYEQLIPSALADGEETWVKCFLFRKEEIVLPNGMSLLYPNLRQEKDDEGKKQWVYGSNATKLYPGKVCNNTNQALARIVMTDGLLRIDKRYRVVGSVHDEGLMMLPENEADEGLKWCIEQMTIEPKYLPGIPLAADGGWHKRYGLAKN